MATLRLTQLTIDLRVRKPGGISCVHTHMCKVNCASGKLPQMDATGALD